MQIFIIQAEYPLWDLFMIADLMGRHSDLHTVFLCVTTWAKRTRELHREGFIPSKYSRKIMKIYEEIGGNKMIVQELEIPLSQVTYKDCMDMYFFRGKSATLNDGELRGFEKEPYVQEIIGGKNE